MNYILKQYDNDLLYFSMKNTNDGLEVLINTVNQNLQYLLPLDLELSNEGLKKWLQKRTIPRNSNVDPVSRTLNKKALKND